MKIQNMNTILQHHLNMKNYDVDPTPNDKHSEQESFVDKIKDKFDKDNNK